MIIAVPTNDGQTIAMVFWHKGAFYEGRYANNYPQKYETAAAN